MPTITDEDLYARGGATLLASWEACARGSAGAAVERLDGVAAAVFPNDPERAFYNNALLERDLDPAARAIAVEAMETAYASAGVDRFAAWVHESDREMAAEMGERGYAIEETTRAMGMSLVDLPAASVTVPGVELGPESWQEYLEYLHGLGVPEGLLGGVDPTAFRVLGAWRGGENVATGLAFDHDRDCGIFNVSTLDAARRCGIGSALSALHLRDAAGRGCTTATLQLTPVAERVYSAAGFRDLGRFLEFVR